MYAFVSSAYYNLTQRELQWIYFVRSVHMFGRLSLSLNHTPLPCYHITLSYIDKVYCLYVQLETLITFHYFGVAHTKI